MRQLSVSRQETRRTPMSAIAANDGEASRPESVLSSVRATSSRLVLAVEDDLRLRMQLATQLEQMGYYSCCVPDGPNRR